MKTKTCTTCGIGKPLIAFHADNRSCGGNTARGGFGVQAQCKECRSETRKPGLRAARGTLAAMEIMGMKKCGKCGTAKQRSEFHKRSASSDGLAFKCKPCVNLDTHNWRKKNPDAHQRWYQENKEYKAKYFFRWRSDHMQTESNRQAKWAKENPEKINALRTKRRVSKLQSTPAWANAIAIEAIYAEAARRTKETGVRHDVDHIVPLQGRVVTGLHWEGNLQVLPKAQNISKHNRRWPDMPC